MDMKPARFTEEQIIGSLREENAGVNRPMRGKVGGQVSGALHQATSIQR
jgi:hypothetical protein